MSTRSIILVTGAKRYSENSETIRVYKHCDGYPTGNLPIIRDTLQSCLEELNEHNERFKGIGKPQPFITEFFVKRLIGESASVYGSGASIDSYDDDSGVYEGFKPEHLGCQIDLDWIYIVDLNNKTLNIYGGGYTGEVPQVAFKKGFVDPEKYIKQLREECKESELKETRELVKSIEDLGFTINKTKDKPTKAKRKSKKGTQGLSLVVNK